MTIKTGPIERQPLWFMALFALAVSGGSIAYVPLLTVLLPIKITALMADQDVEALARVTFYGAIIASLANIAFGMLSDRFANRTVWIAAGLVLSTGLLIAIGSASTLSQVIILVMCWQIGLNMMLAPLVAWAGDCFPDEQKGTLGGFLAFGPAIGAMAPAKCIAISSIECYYQGSSRCSEGHLEASIKTDLQSGHVHFIPRPKN